MIIKLYLVGREKIKNRVPGLITTLILFEIVKVEAIKRRKKDIQCLSLVVEKEVKVTERDDTYIHT